LAVVLGVLAVWAAGTGCDAGAGHPAGPVAGDRGTAAATPGPGPGSPGPVRSGSPSAARSARSGSPGGGPSGPAASGSAAPAQRIDLGALAAEVLRRSSVPVLTYHQIREWRPGDSAVDRQYILPPAVFRAQLDQLAARHATAITVDQLLAHLTTGAALPPRPVLLTFDDSVDDGWTVALPELRRHRFTATYFLMTVVLDHPGYLTRAQVRGLVAAGMTVGAHTWDHHRVDRYAGADWAKQITAPVRELTRLAGRPVHTFAYPYGVWSPAAFGHLRAAGITSAFQLTAEPVSPVAPLLTIRRRIAASSLTGAALTAYLDGPG
jgi:peptidoglycan/xylan/chitin deacetylase (PgdA/CDA1 family)